MTRHAVKCVAIIFLMLGTAAASTAAPAPSPRVRKFLGERATDILRGATRVEVYRLKDEHAADPKPNVGRFAIKSTGAKQGEAFAQRLAAVLLDEHTYLFDSAKECGFAPAVGYRLWKGEEAAVEVVICFQCDELIVHSPKAADGSIRGALEDFDPARAALVKLAKEAFPDDKEIQGLKE